jgi:hypothetical protein
MITVFWDVAPYTWRKLTDVSEMFTASIVMTMIVPDYGTQ